MFSFHVDVLKFTFTGKLNIHRIKKYVHSPFSNFKCVLKLLYITTFITETQFASDLPVIKNNNSNLFDVTMGSYDAPEICELVGLFILNHLGKKFGKKNIGLCRDDVLVIIKNRSARLADKPRKELHKVFEQFGLKTTAEANLRVVNFLDVTFDLITTGKYKPYRKPSDDPLYIHKHSNHPPSIQRQLPASINKLISTRSSDKQVFDERRRCSKHIKTH